MNENGTQIFMIYMIFLFSLQRLCALCALCGLFSRGDPMRHGAPTNE
jgi:hypothetical protein